MTLQRSSLVSFAVAAALWGCSKDSTGPNPADPDITKVTFAASLGIDLSKMTKNSTGLYFRDLTVGTGPAVINGNQASIRYVGWLIDGTQFDANQAPATPFKFTVGSGQVIPGFDEGVRGMQPGGRRQLIIPPALGYGSRAQGPIPANSILVFQIDLVTVQ